ncbi:MAG: hypothetical protein IPQ13_06660 [Holophagaceae bacterium]|nr:hypothetical protein [Holophagaceae bacterium]
MASYFKAAFRSFIGLLLGLVLGAGPLSAQVDPRLQSTKTDFLDLYQQSSSVKVKPEIVTVFDFSGSMDALMFHSTFPNTPTGDVGGNSMSFSISGGGGNNTYTVKAVSRQDSRVTASVDLTVDSGGNVTASNYVTAYPHSTNTSGHNVSSVYTKSSPISIAGTSGSISISITIYIYNNTSGSRTVNTGINPWSVTPAGSTLSPTTSTFSSSLARTTLTSRLNTTTWTVPAYTPPTPPTFSASISGDTVTPTFVALVKPDGSLVTAADADSSKASGSTLFGVSFGYNDVRNWVRAASHARYSYSDGGTLRTIDIPIPWKITDGASTGNPLSSLTAYDPVVTKTVNGSPVTYGSGLNVELDLNYNISNGQYVLAGSSARATSSSTKNVTYRGDFVDWLFKGKYTAGSYTGKYVIFDAVNAALAGGQGSPAWGQGYGSGFGGATIKVPVLKLDGTYSGSEVDKAASLNIIPAVSRTQAVKRAAIKTWIQYQNDVFWAFRLLDNTESGSGSAETLSNSTTSYSPLTGPISTYTGGDNSAWVLMNGNSVNGMNIMASLFADTCTPLTYATARALAQFTDINSVFNAVEVGDYKPSQCMNHYLIVFTDGLDNNSCYGASTSATPYVTGAGTAADPYMVNAKNGNEQIIAAPGSVDRWGANWNMFTFSAIAAHLSDSSLGAVNAQYMPAPATAVTSGVPSALLPFAIKKRGSPVVTFDKDHRITTMTLGVSLGGLYTQAGPKRNMFLAAALGDPALTSWRLDTLEPFVWVPDLVDPSTGKKKDGSIFFFDANDPEKLLSDLGHAFQSALGPSNINSTTNPNLPFIGASLGKQIFIGKFQPPANGGPIWPGDLLMFATKEINNQTVILNNNADVTTTLDASTAQWSAMTALRNNRLWSARNLWTRLPATSTAEPGLVKFSDVDPQYSVIKSAVLTLAPTATTQPYPVAPRVPAATDAAKKLVIQNASGGNVAGALDGTGRPTTNRSTIMGDIIDSNPAAIEYKFSDVSSGFTPALSSFGGNRFRLVLTGTNQGWLHAFGEVSMETTKLDSAMKPQTLTKGAVDELWSFMPTDFLGQMDAVYSLTNNPHRFMVDGAPIIYHLDMPPSAGGSGNGVVDSTERTIAIVGLRKGGRSYYALDIHDPYNPSIKWSLCPDEAANFNSSRLVSGGPDLATVKKILGSLGFSTATPGLGRVMFNGVLRDAVFFTGGYSTSDVEANFKDASGNPTKLGRSVLALDVYTGEVLSAVDMTAFDASIECIPAGMIPFEFFLNSGMAQRSYFLDFKGGLWAWGSLKADAAGPYKDYRQDSSDLAKWTADGAVGSTAGIRKVAKDGTGNNALYSTLPAPFRVGAFPGQAKTAGSPPPAAVGIAMMSGDRYNPVDAQYTTGAGGTRPTNHRLTVVFDRQDSKAWSLDTNGIQDANLLNTALLAAPTTTTIDDRINPGKPTYYLTNTGSPYFGYYKNLPGISATNLIPKGITEPNVVAGSLFYTYFDPTVADPCTGGDGISYSNLICDVLNPVIDDSARSALLQCVSGNQATFAGVTSNYTNYGTRGVIQGGSIAVVNPLPGESKTALKLQTILGKQQERFPKVRVWRTVR